MNVTAIDEAFQVCSIKKAPFQCGASVTSSLEGTTVDSGIAPAAHTVVKDGVFQRNTVNATSAYFSLAFYPHPLFGGACKTVIGINGDRQAETLKV